MAGGCLFENRDVVSDETLRPRIPLGIRNPGPVFRGDVKVVVLGSTRRRQVRVTYTAVATHGHRVRAVEAASALWSKASCQSCVATCRTIPAALCGPMANCQAEDARLAVAPYLPVQSHG